MLVQPEYSRRPYQPPTTGRTLKRDEAFELEADVLLRAPHHLHVAGAVELLRAPQRVSVVGARAASPDAVRRAGKLAAQLAEHGVVVVSGLAEGVDAAAHRGAIAAGGHTIAVIGTPLDRCFPAKHIALQEEIYRRHLLVTQFTSDAPISKTNFPARNRTMAMLSHASVIIEASDTSGSLSQAAEIQRLGRPLFILRSVANNERLTWPARFLRSGARILDDVVELLDALRHPRAAGVQQLPLCHVSDVRHRDAGEAI